MPRSVLEESRIHSAIRDKIANHHADIVAEVEAAIAKHHVVVVAWRRTPCQRKRKCSMPQASRTTIWNTGALNNWRRRNALKMWTGWPTFPMVFVDHVLVGGAEDVVLLKSGRTQKYAAEHPRDVALQPLPGARARR